ncbi:MAG: GAF domain-containing protein [Bacteroidetes bacterium]|nr:GAF domain-containing protein [Bacteroidota bacterium]
MKIKDIINRELVNLSNCEQEPIHIPGSIQPHGFLIALDANSHIIDYCSGNVKDFIGISHEQCLGKKLEEILGEDTAERLVAYVQQQKNAVNPPFELTINGKELLCSMHLVSNTFVAEFESVDPDAPAISAVYDQTIQFVGSMERAETLQELCKGVAEHTRALTGYDRVMIYRFDKDYNGEVFAESKIEGIESYFGLHYPHTDIPAQARRLYLTNLMRMIVSVNDKPVPIYTIDDTPDKTLDLSRSYLRSVSPIHIQYLQNMGVGATLTISLIHNNRLWGLITCHHYSAKYVPLYARIAAQMQGYFLTSQINVRQLNEEYKAGEAINAALEKLLEDKQEATPESFDKIVKDESLLTLCRAGGVAIMFEGTIYKNGKTPGDDSIKKLCTWLDKHTKHGEYATSRLNDVYPEAKEFASTGAGIIYHSLSGIQNDCVVWFAPETKEEVHWGGNPDTAIVKTEKGLSPRNSFELWKQILQYQSKEWTKPELLATATFAHALQKHVTLILISEEEKRHRLLTQQLQEANTELENINWISSHDLKEPLRKIQMFASKLLDREQERLSESGILSLQKVNKSANKMQQLISDITAYNKVRHLHEQFETIELGHVLEEVKDELKDEIAEHSATISYDELPQVKGIPLLLRQLFLNLIRNSLKFSRPGIPPEVNIRWATDASEAAHGDGFNRIIISDNGIGFDNSFAESIFKVFTRLHGISQYEGSGIGLALCRKIMQNHKGYIQASGTPGEGASFSLYFPAVKN